MEQVIAQSSTLFLSILATSLIQHVSLCFINICALLPFYIHTCTFASFTLYRILQGTMFDFTHHLSHQHNIPPIAMSTAIRIGLWKASIRPFLPNAEHLRRRQSYPSGSYPHKKRYFRTCPHPEHASVSFGGCHRIRQCHSSHGLDCSPTVP